MIPEHAPNTPSCRQDNPPRRRRDRDDNRPFTLTPDERQHVFDWNGWHDKYEPNLTAHHESNGPKA